MASYYTFLSLHILGATIWAGGHLVLALTILPDALRQQRAASSDFFAYFSQVASCAEGGKTGPPDRNAASNSSTTRC